MYLILTLDTFRSVDDILNELQTAIAGPIATLSESYHLQKATLWIDPSKPLYRWSNYQRRFFRDHRAREYQDIQRSR